MYLLQVAADECPQHLDRRRAEQHHRHGIPPRFVPNVRQDDLRDVGDLPARVSRVGAEIVIEALQPVGDCNRKQPVGQGPRDRTRLEDCAGGLRVSWWMSSAMASPEVATEPSTSNTAHSVSRGVHQATCSTHQVSAAVTMNMQPTLSIGAHTNTGARSIGPSQSA